MTRQTKGQVSGTFEHLRKANAEKPVLEEPKEEKPILEKPTQKTYTGKSNAIKY